MTCLDPSTLSLLVGFVLGAGGMYGFLVSRLAWRSLRD